jgi:hypothetical protein
MSKVEINKEDLVYLYFTQKLSFAQLGKYYRCHAQTICNRFEEFGLIARTISESMEGRTHTWGDKISNSLKDHVISDATKEKIRQKSLGRPTWNKGLRKSKDPIMKNTGMVKENHPNWHGGISNINSIIRQTSEYKVWREEIFKRDNWTCQNCQTRSKMGNRVCIEAHHLKSFKDYPELRFVISNGVTVCKKCHKEMKKENGNKKQTL